MSAGARSIHERWDIRSGNRLEKAFYGRYVERALPESYDELADLVRYAETRRRPLVPAGEGAHAYLGNPPPERALIVSLEKLRSILRYQPDDFTVGVQAGLPLSELREELARNRQELIADVRRGAPGTVGGLVAAAVPGPRRARRGPLRSSLIGIHAMRGGGRIYRSGGMVVKNVAGYEVQRFLAGSLGTAGVILEANFKLRPLPARRIGGWAGFADRRDACAFVRALSARRLEPAALAILSPRVSRRLGEALESGSEGERWLATWIYEGNRSLVAWLRKETDAVAAERTPDELAALSGEQADRVLDALSAALEPDDPPERAEAVVRLLVRPSRTEEALSQTRSVFSESLPPEIVADPLTGHVIVRWEGTREALEPPLEGLAGAARALDGAGWLVYLPPEARRRFGYLLLEDPSSGLARRFLRVLDPVGIFCPGRVDGVIGVRY